MRMVTASMPPAGSLVGTVTGGLMAVVHLLALEMRVFHMLFVEWKLLPCLFDDAHSILLYILNLLLQVFPMTTSSPASLPRTLPCLSRRAHTVSSGSQGRNRPGALSPG